MFEVTIDVPGVDEKNIDIELKEEQQGQTLLTVRGQRMASMSESSSESQVMSKFSKTFSLDDTVDVDKLTAALKNGVLTVSAPKDPTKREQNIRRIPVQVVAEAAETTPAITVDGENASTGEGDGFDGENASADEGDDASMEHAEKDKAEEIIVVDVD